MTPDNTLETTLSSTSAAAVADLHDADGETATAAAIGPLSLGGLEEVYDALAEGLDAAGDDASERFLVKLALLNAQALGDAGLMRRHIAIALRDL